VPTLPLLCLLALAACNLPPPIPHTEPFPPGFPHEQLTPAPGTAFAHIYINEKDAVLDDGTQRALLEGGIRLVPLDGQLAGGAYRATRVAIATLYDPVFKARYWSVAAECHGSFVLDEHGAQIALEGPGDCGKVKASFVKPAPAAASPAPAGKPSPARTGPCPRYRDCICALAAAARGTGAGRLATMRDAFAKNCDEAGRLLDTAKDDASACETGLVAMTGVAQELSGTLPAACQPPR
jgi:hypothetical protein